MKTKLLPVILVILVITTCTTDKIIEKPPLVKVQVVVDNYFGREISDPYRYMENLQDSIVQNWFKSQSDYSRSVLNSISGRQSLIDKMLEFDQRKSSGIQWLQITDNDRYFYMKSTPEDETVKLYIRDGYEGTETLLYDPQTFSTDTTRKFAILLFYPSDDGSKVAISVAPSGSESSVLLAMDVESKEIYPEQIDRCWFAFPSWLPDCSGFLYSRLQSGDVHNKDRQQDSKAYLHLVGTDPATDKEIFSRVNYPELGIMPEDIPRVLYDNNSQYIFCVPIRADRRLSVFYTPTTELGKEKLNWVQLIKREDEVYDFTFTENELYVFTPKEAPNYKILKTSLNKPDLANAEVVVPENPGAKLKSYSLTKEGLYYTLSVNGIQEKLYFLPYGTEEATELNLPFAAGAIFLGTKGYKFSDVWVSLSGWTSTVKRYRYLVDNNEFKHEPLVFGADYPEYDDLTVEELLITSHDGVKVPLTLIYNKGVKKNGKNPTLIYGYGSYGSSMTPYFDPNRLLWTQEGGIYAVAHVRGGGELGDPWHRDGFKSTKPNTWKDLIACAEYMVTEKYTSPQKIAIYALSAGGILAGRAMTERPDLFAAVISEVGIMNPLRLEESPNGPMQAFEFGTVKDSVECMALIEMDPYLSLKDGVKYPATLVTAGMNDPRVIAWLPAKFAARLQAVNASDKPILFWIDYEAGHGVGDTRTEYFEKLSDVLSFALWQTGNPHYQIK